VAHSRESRGISLVEVLVLIAVIGLILFVAIPNSVRAQAEENHHHCRANLEHIFINIVRSEKPDGTAVAPEWLTQILGQRSCPSGGEYRLDKVGELPTCTHEGHAMLPPYRDQPGESGEGE